MRIHAPWDEDESSSGCPRGPRLQSTLIIELRALERAPLDRTLEISLSVISHVSPLYDRVDAFSFYRRIRVSEKKNIEKNIHRFFNSSADTNRKLSRSSFDGQRTSRPVFEKFLLGKFRIFKFGINRTKHNLALKNSEDEKGIKKYYIFIYSRQC